MAHDWNAQEYDTSFGFVTAFGAPLLDLVAARPGERVLDLGCGTGHQGAALAAAGAQVVALDQDAAMLAVARREHADVPGLRFVQADAMSFGADEVGEPVDAVLSNAALHWMTDPHRVLRCTRSVMRTGARFVAEMGGHGNVARVRGAVTLAVAEVGDLPREEVESRFAAHSYFPTPAQQAGALEADGFVVRRLEYFDRPTPLTGTVADWAAHFRPDVLALVPGSEQAELRARIDALAEAEGLRTPAGWSADYVRLRFVAVAV